MLMLQVVSCLILTLAGLTGTTGDDLLYLSGAGSSRAAAGGAGNDLILDFSTSTTTGNSLYGGAASASGSDYGHDEIYAGSGNDMLYGGEVMMNSMEREGMI